jgi:ferrous iron transport protein B
MKISLAGNPNCGKTTLFNALTGSNQYVGNWPGVTVEKKEGKIKNNNDISVIDLPGIYSLSPYTIEEVVTRNFLIDERPDVILNIVDGTNLERNLFLTTQLVEIGLPVVIAVNFMDIVEKNGDIIDLENLSKKTGCNVCVISALKENGIDEAIALCEKEVGRKTAPKHHFSGCVEHTLAHIEEHCLHDLPDEQQRFFAIKLFERDVKIIEKLKLDINKINHIEKDIRECEEELGDDSESIITSERYGYIDKIKKQCITVSKKNNISNKIDNILTNKYLAFPIFALVMFIVYYISVTTVGSFVTDWTNNVLFGEIIPPFIENILIDINCAEWLQALILDGIVAGVGAVLGFVPQMFVLFFFLSFLEYCGYMSRIAFIMDKIFRKFGLSGKSFIPILIGTGCSVPGIMASRTIENERDRKITIITTSFIPCSAKLPIIALIAGAIFDGAAFVATLSYFIGIFAIICSGIILKNTKLFKSDDSPFVMELPMYHMPTAKSLLISTWDRGFAFVKRAGTVILIATVVIWFLSNYGFEAGKWTMTDMDSSILATIGRGIAWLFVPLGFGTWQDSVAVITGLVAKENVVGTFGILFGHESDADIWGALRGHFTQISAFSFLLFNLLCAPCFAAMGAIWKEMGSFKWFLFAFCYQTAFAYTVSLLVYQVGFLIC